MNLTPEKIARIDATVMVEMEKRKLAGLAFGLLLDNEVALLKIYGHADQENQIPVTTETMFRWASITKPLAAIAAMQLVEQGSLDLDINIRNYVPEFPDKGVTITTRHLLAHQSGLNHYANISPPRQYDEPHPFADPVVALDVFKDGPLLFPPGEKCAYSSFGYMLLSAVVQRAGNKKFPDQIIERITQPLNLATIQPDYQWENIPHRAIGYRLDQGSIVRSLDTDQSWKWGAGNYISTIGDLAGFAQGLIGEKLVSRETKKQMWTQQTTRDGQPSAIVYGGITTPYGLGFQLQTNKQGETIKPYHTGGQEKVRTRLMLYPEKKSAMVVMTNSEWGNPAFFSTLIYGLLAKD